MVNFETKTQLYEKILFLGNIIFILFRMRRDANEEFLLHILDCLSTKNTGKYDIYGIINNFPLSG